MGHDHSDHAHDHEHDHDHAHPHTHEHREVDPNHVEFIGQRPVLNVANVAASLAYYVGKLGFELGFAWSDSNQFGGGAAPTFASVMRGHAVLYLAQQTQGGPGMWVCLDLESPAEVQKLYTEYQASGAIIVDPPTQKPWNMIEMRVQDLDGHTFRIGAGATFERA